MVLSNLKMGLEDRIKGLGNNIKRKVVVGVLSAGLAFSPYGCGDSNVEYMTPVSAQAIVYQCSDGVDNDNDTMTDFNDIGCYINGLYDPNRDSELQVQIYECSDKVDNDSDGVIDLDDVGCYTDGIFDPSDNSEMNNGVYQCNDGVDNDGDTNIDWGFDNDCSSPVDNDESPFVLPQCSDWINNDNDNYIDINDAGCYDSNGRYDPNDNDESNNGVTQCSDNIDNDNDGFIDWPADLGCLNPLYDNESSTGGTSSACSDGIDNDGDTKIDYNDLGCYLDSLYNPNDNDETGDFAKFIADANTIALYHFNELSGNGVVDSSGNGLNGITNGTTIVDGIYGKARSFSGSGDYIGIPFNSLMNVSNITVEAYVNLNTIAGSQRIADRYFYPGGRAWSFSISGGILTLNVSSDCSGDKEISAPAPLTINEWHHVAFTYNELEIKILQDNNIVRTEPYSAGICTTGTSPLTIGAYFNRGESFFNGLMDEVRISNIIRY